VRSIFEFTYTDVIAPLERCTESGGWIIGLVPDLYIYFNLIGKFNNTVLSVISEIYVSYSKYTEICFRKLVFNTSGSSCHKTAYRIDDCALAYLITKTFRFFVCIFYF
jgi:hypothetical protein